MTIATMPMYDLPELQAANDALWAALARALRDAGIAAPSRLDRNPDLKRLWTDPSLLLGQACGYPLMTELSGKVALLTTPCYDAPGCDGALYRSAFIVRATDRADRLSDLTGRRCAVNDAASNSGMNVLRAAVAPLARIGERFFGEVVMTASHAASMQAVADGAADIAALDCITWAHLQHLRPEPTGRLRVLDWSAATPGLPMITSRLAGAEMKAVLLRALMDLTSNEALREARATLRLQGFMKLPLAAYDAILDLERRAIAAGYPVLR